MLKPAETKTVEESADAVDETVAEEPGKDEETGAAEEEENDASQEAEETAADDESEEKESEEDAQGQTAEDAQPDYEAIYAAYEEVVLQIVNEDSQAYIRFADVDTDGIPELSIARSNPNIPSETGFNADMIFYTYRDGSVTEAGSFQVDKNFELLERKKDDGSIWIRYMHAGFGERVLLQMTDGAVVKSDIYSDVSFDPGSEDTSAVDAWMAEVDVLDMVTGDNLEGNYGHASLSQAWENAAAMVQ